MAEGGIGFDWLTKGSIAGKLKRISDASSLLALILAIVTVTGLVVLNNQAKNASEISHSVRALAAVDREVDAARAGYVQYSRSLDAAALAQTQNALENASRQTQELRLQIAESEILPVSEIDALSSAVQLMQANFVELSAAETSLALPAEGYAASEAFAQQEAVLIGQFAEQAGALERTNFNLITFLLFFTSLVGLGAVVTSLFGRKFVREEFVQPVEGINSALQKLSNRDRDVEIPCLDRDDELGEIARALELIKGKAREFDALRTVHDKERIEQDELLASLAEKFKLSVSEVVGGVAAATSQLQTTATEMAQAADLTSSQTDNVSSTLGEASAGVTAAAAASDEFAMSIGEISRQASTAAELARKANESASEADATISDLSDSAGQVGQVVEMISTIAQRTNLLALNASIEAARGGEAGRGFAVVAAEVKELATQTGKFTEEVAVQIRSMQETTTASVDALRSIIKQICELEETSISIAAAVDQQSIAGQDLARSIDLAARSTEEVTGNVTQVRATSQSTGTAASQVLISSTELEKQAGALKSQVEGFLSNISKSAA